MPGAIDYAEFLESFESETFREFRPGQQAVLDRYRDGHSVTPDLAIELPTGAGKSLVALLVAEAWRQEGHSVGILSANKTLAHQMEDEAADLGVDVCVLEGSRDKVDPRDPRAVQRKQRIGVMNYWFYFNQNPSIDPLDLIIMDDAHLAEQALQSLFSVEINRFDHQELFERLVAELAVRLPDYPALASAADPDSARLGSADLITFYDQHAIHEVAVGVVEAAALTQDLSYRWSRLKDRLLLCNLYVTRHSLQWRPWVYPLQEELHYSQAQQRLYMSATIGDPADLRRRLGTQHIERMELPQELSDDTLGRRLIILDRDEAQERSVAALGAGMQAQQKSVWMCGSRAQAERTRSDVAEQIQETLGLPPAPSWLLTSTGPELEQFKNADAGQLFTAGRFDGMDFDGGQCRVFCVPALPRATNPQEEFLSAELADAVFLVERLNARIVQALGRGNRGPDDYAIYILSDPRFLGHFSRESFRASLPAPVNAEIDVAQDHVNSPPDDVRQRVAAFLAGDFATTDQELQEAQALALDPPGPPPGWSAELAELEVEGWRELWVGDFLAAERLFERWATACDEHDLHELGGYARWCQAKAAFLEGARGDDAAANRTLDALTRAIAQGGKHSTWFNRLRASVHRYDGGEVPDPQPDEARDSMLRAWDQLFLDRGDSARRWEKLRNSVTDDLGSGSHARYQQALERIGELLGYRAVRPRGQAATDLRWTGSFLGSKELYVFECKIEHVPANELTAGSVDQALGQLTTADGEWTSRGFHPRGVIITHLNTLAPEAASRLGPLALLPHRSIEALWDRLALLVGLFREQWSIDDVVARRHAATQVAPSLPATGWLGRALDTADPWVEQDALLAEWAEN